MGIGYLSAGEAQVINNMNQAAQNTQLGSQVRYALSTTTPGTKYYVSLYTGNDANDGLSWDSALKNLQTAIDKAGYYDGTTIYVALGSYNEAITIARTKGGLTLIGCANKGEVAIAPTTAGAEGCIVRADDVTFFNIGVAGNTTGDYALKVTGDRFRAYGCKLEGADTSGTALVVACGTIAQIAALTDKTGSDCLFEDCEICWTFNGVKLVSSDYGAATQNKFVNCHFHNCATVCIGETDTGAIGAVRNILVKDCTFDNAEDGTAPTDYIDLNSAGCTGLITGCQFATATNAATVLQIASGILWVANGTEAGLSTARPA